jgi:microcystin degradation protein MlrC
MSKRVLLAGLFHETNTFLNGLITPEECYIRRGEELWEAAGDGSPLAGVLEVAQEKNWEVVPIIDVRAMPGPTIADSVTDLFWSAFKNVAERERTRGLDGIFLVLHGAMVSQSLPDVEGEMLRRIRHLDGFVDLPLCGVLDLHGNFTAKMARYSSGLVSYRENPHTDAMVAAQDAALLLDRCMCTGERPITVWEHPPLIWPPTGTATADEPMYSLESLAREIEQSHPEILAVNVFAGFSFADVPEAGVSFSAVTVGDPEKAHEALKRLSTLAISLKEHGNQIGEPLEKVMPALAQQREGPVLLVEPADNVGGGAPGDCTVVLRALLEHGIKNAGVILNDPDSVRRLAGRAVGERVRLEIGGKSGVLGAEPVPLEVELVSTSTGRFTLEDRQSHLAAIFGEQIDMGPCAVVKHGSLRILLTTHKMPPFDLGQWRSQGINPEELFAINVKAAVAHRHAYDPIAKASYTLDTPGPCASNLRRLPFKHVKRPIYPLDDVETSTFQSAGNP